MPKLLKALLITVFIVVIVVVFLNSALFTSIVSSMAPLFSRTAQTDDALPDDTITIDEIAHVELLENFTQQLLNADAYSFSAEKKIIGGASPSASSFSCYVENDDYAIIVTMNDKIMRQLYLKGIYYLLNDTDDIYYRNTSLINYPDSHLLDACSGKVVRMREAIINNEQSYCFEVYAENTVFELYFSPQGNLLRYGYISDSYIITIDFDEFIIGAVPAEYLTIPLAYASGIYSAGLTEGVAVGTEDVTTGTGDTTGQTDAETA